jgi:hypothetical protein
LLCGAESELVYFIIIHFQIILILTCFYVEFEGDSKEGEALVNEWKVIMTKSDAEPWWFFEDWKRDIVEEWKYDNKSDAIAKYKEEIVRLNRLLPEIKTKYYNSFAFWHPDEIVFCEACDDDLQIYHGIILFENDDPMEMSGNQDKLKEEIKSLITKKD